MSTPDLLINGNYYSFSSIELDIGGTKFRSIKEISYSHGKERGLVRGTRTQPIGRTAGDYSCEASMSLTMPDWDSLRTQLGTGFMDTVFDLTISYADDGQPTTTDEVVGCVITKVEKGHSQGTDALMAKLTLQPMYVIENDVEPIESMLR